VAATAALAVLLQQRRDHLDGLCRGGGALQAETQQVHADQRRLLLWRNARVHRLVADHHAMLVGAHLGAPDPERPAQQCSKCLPDLRDRDVGAVHARIARMLCAREEFHDLRLVAFAVAVLAEQHPASRCGARQSYNRITHGFLVQLVVNAGTTRPRHSPKPMVTAPARWQCARNTTSSPSSR
jgi:hypothetical protein